MGKQQIFVNRKVGNRFAFFENSPFDETKPLSNEIYNIDLPPPQLCGVYLRGIKRNQSSRIRFESRNRIPPYTAFPLYFLGIRIVRIDRVCYDSTFSDTPSIHFRCFLFSQRVEYRREVVLGQRIGSRKKGQGFISRKRGFRICRTVSTHCIVYVQYKQTSQIEGHSEGNREKGRAERAKGLRNGSSDRDFNVEHTRFESIGPLRLLGKQSTWSSNFSSSSILPLPLTAKPSFLNP